MKFFAAAALIVSQVALTSAVRAEIISAYSDLNTEKDCSTFAAAPEGEGDWANMICAGYKGYPVVLYYGDARENVFYGFPPDGDLAPAWESFSAFNSSGPKVEWRIEKGKGVEIPFATIHRRVVSDPENPEKKIEVLLVAKVGQILERDGCVVGLVLASGNPKANDTARKIADEQARTFACGADERVIVGEPMPEFSRQEQ